MQDIYMDGANLQLLAPPFLHFFQNSAKVSENGHFSLVMEVDGGRSRPYTCVYNRRWDHSTWYLPTKNLLTLLTHTVYEEMRSVFVFQRLQLVTRLEAVSLALRCSSLFDSTLASGSSVNTLQFDVALVPLN